MTDSGSRTTTKCGSRPARKSLSVKPPAGAPLLPGLVRVGTRFGLWRTLTEVWRDGAHRKVWVCCTCGKTSVAYLDNLTARKSRGCRSCQLRSTTTPKWLRGRMQTARQRCTNPKHPCWEDYGGRGIEFRFSSVATAAEWIAANIGLHPKLEIDRIDVNGHYEPGNLRWATDTQQVWNRRNTKLDETWVFRQSEWPLSKKAVEKKLRAGMTREQIIDEAKEYVARRRNWWRRVAARLESMTS